MGRKKRKIAVDDPVDAAVKDEETVVKDEVMAIPVVKTTTVRFEENSEDDEEDTDLKNQEGDGKTTEEEGKKPISSGYAMTTHTGEIVQEDTYVSDGSESEDDHDEELEIVLIGSRMGIMRRGLLHAGTMVQPNRQWTRTDPAVSEEKTQEQRKQQEEEELAKLDPAERAARLLQEKQRKLEEAKELARRSEAEENAGRDSMLFSKRTAFDIRFDQIEDKPWLRGDVSDYFNYGMTEEDWLEYSQQQLLIRQELIDARRQKRLPDPNLVPVTPRETVRWPITPIREAVKTEDNPGAEDEITQIETTIEPEPSMGPERPEQVAQPSAGPTPPQPDIPVGSGGAWGAGAAPGSILAKLIEDQERQLEDPGGNDAEYYPNEDRQPYAAAQPEEWADDGYNNADSNNHYGEGGYGESSRGPSNRESNTWNRPPPPPPSSDHYYNSRSQQSYAPPPSQYHEAPSRHHHEAPPRHHHEAPPHHHHEAPPHHSGGYRGRGGDRGRGGGRGYDRYGGGGRNGGRGPGRGGGADSGRGGGADSGRDGGADYYGSRKRSWEGDSRRPRR
jgi:hypothetical protein